MRIWDIDPGYLNRQSLLGEHRELHGLVSILLNGKKGYSRHPETLRWRDYGWALKYRHKQLASEMKLRGYVDRSPVRTRSKPESWPTYYIDNPLKQFELLKEKYIEKEMGRIELPSNEEQLWRQHKYSILARDPSLYKSIGQKVARNRICMSELSELLVKMLRIRPSAGGIRNAVQHMWGYVSGYSEEQAESVNVWSTEKLLLEIQKRVMEKNQPYIMNSTALSELMVWL
ncbi:MAG: DUF1722 domain-containing protein [Bacteroidetes bacterium]|nr:MAG: DUF1722 domain-containing protein [Bacteroidota bacterium]